MKRNQAISPGHVNRRKTAILGFFLLFLCVFSTALHAEETKDLVEAPHYPDNPPTADEFLRDTEIVSYKNEDQPHLAFNVRVPKDWTKEEAGRKTGAGVSDKLLETLVRYMGKDIYGLPSQFEVLVTRLDDDIVRVEDWFDDYMIERGYNYVAKTVHSDLRVEAIYAAIIDGDPFFVRTIAEINGEDLVLVSYYLYEDRWMDERGWQDKVITSFEFVAPLPPPDIKTATHRFLDVFEFNYPNDWNINVPRLENLDETSVQLLKTSDKNTVDGEIVFLALTSANKSELPRRLEAVNKRLALKKLQLGDLRETRNKYNLGSYIKGSRIDVYKTLPLHKNQLILEHEYWVAVMVGDGYYFVVAMLTPNREEFPRVWSLNERAFKIVIESLRSQY